MPKLEKEHCILLSPLDAPDFYLVGESPDEDELRIQFVQSNSICSFDYSPLQLWRIGQAILDALAEEGYCEHGVRSKDNEFCEKCILGGIDIDEPEND